MTIEPRTRLALRAAGKVSRIWRVKILRHSSLSRWTQSRAAPMTPWMALPSPSGLRKSHCSGPPIRAACGVDSTGRSNHKCAPRMGTLCNWPRLLKRLSIPGKFFGDPFFEDGIIDGQDYGVGSDKFIAQFDPDGARSFEADGGHAATEANVAAGERFIELAERAGGGSHAVGGFVKEHSLLKNLNGVGGAGIAAVFVEGADKNQIVEFVDQIFRLVVLSEPLAEGNIGEFRAAGGAETQHRQHCSGEVDAFAGAQGSEGCAGETQMQRGGKAVDGPQAMFAAARIEKMDGVFPMDSVEDADAAVEIEKVDAAA